ncbi:hypothetical protein MKW98_002455 [Papaver atlanticum]|uniref:Uncharacterized protein n=1 Tax=Papaver atlanticum TaxID=357466 RepID=A0AAD4XB29_9MAGN|nr:hypothetical protein MKW98_002455 [Papaver atlanticum]
MWRHPYKGGEWRPCINKSEEVWQVVKRSLDWPHADRWSSNLTMLVIVQDLSGAVNPSEESAIGKLELSLYQLEARVLQLRMKGKQDDAEKLMVLSIFTKSGRGTSSTLLLLIPPV